MYPVGEYTKQKYKRKTFVFAPCFSWAEFKDPRLRCIKKAFFFFSPMIVHKPA